MIKDRISYNGLLTTPTTDLTTVKIHLNHTVSTPGGKYNVINIKGFCLKTLISECGDCIPLSKIPQEIIAYHDLILISHGGGMTDISKDIQVLPQVGILTNKQLKLYVT